MNTEIARLDLYNPTFGFRKVPFSLTPDATCFYLSPTHRRAYDMLEYGLLSQVPLSVITGAVGTGKTTLIHKLLRECTDNIKIGMISSLIDPHESILAWVLSAFDLPVAASASSVHLFRQFERFLIEQYAAGKQVVIIFDEAQTLSQRRLEEIRLLTNINSNSHDVLQIILVGQPELRDMLLAPDMSQFAQRIGCSFHLEALAPPSLAGYILHRLTVSGGNPDIFSLEAISEVHKLTNGVPRLVNLLCDVALLYASAEDNAVITAEIVREAAHERFSRSSMEEKFVKDAT